MKKICLIIAVFVFLGLGIVNSSASAQSEDELKKKIEEYQAQIVKLTSQANTLANQIAQFDAQIKLSQLKIDQTQEKIAMLGGRIDQLETSLTALTLAFSTRAVETYKMYRYGDGMLFLLASNDLGDAFLRFEYLRQIQEEDRQLLMRLTAVQSDYKGQKTDQEDLQKELEVQKAALDGQKRAKAALLTVTRNDEKKYQQLLAQARAQLSALSRFAQSVGISLIPHQDLSDSWGKYYNQRDSQWGNLLVNGDTHDCRGGSCTLARIGCLVTAYAMVASHFGGSLLPSDVAINPYNFYANTADFNNPGPSANGHLATRMDNPSLQQLRDALGSGKIVIAGMSMSGGPYPNRYSDHWVVLRSVDGDSFRVNDPVYPGAMNVLLKDHYSGWTIIQARIYQ